MSETALCYLSGRDAIRSFTDRTLSPVELVRALLDRIDAVNPELNCFTVVHSETSLAAARHAEAVYRSGSPRPLEGVPLAVKDGNAVAGDLTTYGSRVYADNRPERTHPGVQRLLDAGAILLARTTMPEFGEAANCYTPLWGVTRNPWNPAFGPGGSSSGAGAALAAGLTTLADGSDIGGSIRIPAACCGVLGYKPPYGRNPNASDAQFDPYQHYGPLARTVRDLALMQNVVSGFHPEDIATLREKVVVPDRLDSVRGWRIAYSIDLGYFEVDHDVARNMMAVIEAFHALGCATEEVPLDWTPACLEAWSAVNGSRGSAARRIGDVERWRPLLADYTADWLDRGARVTQADLARAYETHVAMYRSLGPILEAYDLFICPTNAIPSIEAERSPLNLDFEINGRPAPRHVAEAWFMTYPFNMLSQLPVMSVPSGFATTGVPTGVQLVGPSYDDTSVFRAAAALEGIIGWRDWRPGGPKGTTRRAPRG